ncbi:Hint domain-containing protein [Streptomyces anulatus]|uniref:Hint domain-containing protein n=1 Tax=Streptomyces anulatus TaxID=1892 RepID=UPI002151D34C|nr:Hint domain-containing protein [Streptomyces anulatus]
MSQQNPASGDEPPTGPVSPSGPVHGWWQRLSSWQRAVLPAGILTLVIAVIAAAVLNSGSSSDAPTAARDLQPFREAVDDLAKAPGLQYKDTSAFGITENTLTVTAAGSTYGTTSSGPSDNARDVLRIGGKKFTRWQVDPSPRKDAAAGEKAQPSEWSVGLDDGSTLTDEALARTLPPPKLAAVLDKALADLEKSPPPAANSAKGSDKSGQRTLNVNGTPALGIDTSAGRLLVTKQKPHRALRLEAYALRDGIADMKDQLENGETPSAPRTVTTGPLASGDAKGMDLTPVLADAADKMFDTLVEYTDQLENATDRGITFTLDNAGEMDCSPKGCTATQSFTGNVSSIARKERVTKGEVSAVMSATFSIDGKPAGECTSPQRTFPVRGNNVSGTLKCSNPGAGPLYASVAARVQAQAQADADRCGCKVRLTYPVRANTLIDARALAKVEAKKLADQAKAERTAADCAKPHSFPTGTHVLLANGTTRPIEEIRIGDFVTASDPQTGRTAARPVTNTFTTEGDKNFTRITVTTGQGPATITATGNHPFWLPQDQQWKDAEALRTGDELRTPNGSGATVTEVRDQQGRQRTHDLTVNDLHTYYALAGSTPVLVHNCNADPQSAPGGKNGAAVSIKQVKAALGRAGMSVSRYDIVHVPEIRTAGGGLPAYGNSPHNGKGMPNLGPRGRPVIEISNMGLASMDTAVATIFHEIHHHRMFATWPESMGGTESAAEEFGQAMLGDFRRRTGS